MRLILLLVLLPACELASPPASPFVAAGQTPPPLVLHQAELPEANELDVCLDGIVASGAESQLLSF